MQRLMDVANKMDDEAQGLGTMRVVGAVLQYLDVLLQSGNDVVLVRKVWQFRAVVGEGKIGEVQLQGLSKRFIRPEIVRPVGGIHEIQALGGDGYRVNAELDQFVHLGLGVVVQAAISDLGHN